MKPGAVPRMRAGTSPVPRIKRSPACHQVGLRAHTGIRAAGLGHHGSDEASAGKVVASGGFHGRFPARAREGVPRASYDASRLATVAIGVHPGAMPVGDLVWYGFGGARIALRARRAYG